MVSLLFACIIDADEVDYLSSSIGIRVYLSIFLAIKVLITVLVSTLLIFHLYLNYKGVTTYELLSGIPKEKKAPKKSQIHNVHVLHESPKPPKNGKINFVTSSKLIV